MRTGAHLDGSRPRLAVLSVMRKNDLRTVALVVAVIVALKAFGSKMGPLARYVA